MKKKLFAFAFVLVSVLLTSCTKFNDYEFWRVETSTIHYIKSEYSTLEAFSDAIDNLDGTSYSVSQVKNKINTIVRKYDNGVIQCSIYLKVGPTSSGPWTTEETWYLDFNPRYK